MRFWAIVALIIFASFGCATPEPTPTPTAEPTPIPTVTPRERFSEDALTLRAAFEELIRIKDETWFHVRCYSVNGPAHQWVEYINAMNRDKSIQMRNETGIAPGDLWMMGADFCENAGAHTDYTNWLLREMEPDWVNLRPVPTPIPAVRIVADRPFARTARELAECAWDNPAMWDLFGDDIAASASVDEFALVIEGAVETGTETTWDGVIVSLTLCQQTRP